MSQYTTGEIARECEVSVRTVQFYDTKGLLKPSELTEGGRRLYSESDLSSLRLICLLKSMGLSLDSIKGIMESEQPGKVLLVLLEEQTKRINDELSQMQRRKDTVQKVIKSIRSGEINSVNSIRDIENTMNGRKKLKKIYIAMLAVGILMDIAEVAAIVYWVKSGNWVPFAIIMPFVLAGAAGMVAIYYKNTEYICPECGERFKPGVKEFFFAKHTFKTRKLSCTKCGKKGWCVETYAQGAEE